jgi:hypothetical protein
LIFGEAALRRRRSELGFNEDSRERGSELDVREQRPTVQLAARSRILERNSAEKGNLAFDLLMFLGCAIRTSFASTSR